MGSNNIQALLSDEINGTRIPFIYSVRPLISSPESHHDDGRGSLQWVDKQHADYVLFVSFGSVNFLSVEKIMELALELEGNGHKWSGSVYVHIQKRSPSVYTHIKKLSVSVYARIQKLATFVYAHIWKWSAFVYAHIRKWSASVYVHIRNPTASVYAHIRK